MRGPDAQPDPPLILLSVDASASTANIVDDDGDSLATTAVSGTLLVSRDRCQDVLCPFQVLNAVLEVADFRVRDEVSRQNAIAFAQPITGTLWRNGNCSSSGRRPRSGCGARSIATGSRARGPSSPAVRLRRHRRPGGADVADPLLPEPRPRARRHPLPACELHLASPPPRVHGARHRGLRRRRGLRDRGRERNLRPRRAERPHPAGVAGGRDSHTR